MYGEPGTGKTLLAKAVANSTSATFLRVVGSELIQKYLGDGPKLVRELFRVAEELAPTIVFIGEAHSLLLPESVGCTMQCLPCTFAPDESSGTSHVSLSFGRQAWCCDMGSVLHVPASSHVLWS